MCNFEYRLVETFRTADGKTTEEGETALKKRRRAFLFKLARGMAAAVVGWQLVVMHLGLGLFWLDKDYWRFWIYGILNSGRIMLADLDLKNFGGQVFVVGGTVWFFISVLFGESQSGRSIKKTPREKPSRSQISPIFFPNCNDEL